MTTNTDGNPIHRVVERDVEELVGGGAEIAGPEERSKMNVVAHKRNAIGKTLDIVEDLLWNITYMSPDLRPRQISDDEWQEDGIKYSQLRLPCKVIRELASHFEHMLQGDVRMINMERLSPSERHYVFHRISRLRKIMQIIQCLIGIEEVYVV